MTRYGFTGSKEGTILGTILSTLRCLGLTKNDLIVTGGCIGIDAQVSHLAKKYFPFVKQLILIPANKSKVDKSVYKNGEVIFMPQGTSYRYRNCKLVKKSDKMTAFWNGKKIHSGTYMTINIAKRNNIPCQIVDI